MDSGAPLGSPVRMPTSLECLKGKGEEGHTGELQSPAPKHWARREGAKEGGEDRWSKEKEWGRSHGFSESCLEEIENVLDLMDGQTIPSGSVTGMEHLDRGSFGEIFRASMNHTESAPGTVPVAVKRVDQHSTPSGTTWPQVPHS